MAQDRPIEIFLNFHFSNIPYSTIRRLTRVPPPHHAASINEDRSEASLRQSHRGILGAGTLDGRAEQYDLLAMVEPLLEFSGIQGSNVFVEEARTRRDLTNGVIPKAA